MSYYDALKTEWATLTGTTAQKLATINALTVAGPVQPVPIVSIISYLRGNDLWAGIKAAAAAGTSVGAAAAVDINADMRMQTINFSLPVVGKMLADLVAKKLLTQAQSDAITAMSATSVPWWQANGYPRAIDDGDLKAAGGLV